MSEYKRSDALALWARLSEEYRRYQDVIPELPTAQIKVQEDLRRYLCLRCAGFLEQVVFVALNGYLERKAEGPVRDFAQSWFKRAPNLTPNAFRTLMERFGDNHGQAFDAFLTPTRKKVLDDLLEIRNGVAHGKTLAGAKLAPERYVQLCEDTYHWLIDVCYADSVDVLSADGRTVTGAERMP